MPKPMRLVSRDDQPTRMTAEDAMAQIEADWIAWRSPNSDVATNDGWRPTDDLATKPLDVDSPRGYLIITSEPFVPFWRRALRRMKGLR